MGTGNEGMEANLRGRACDGSPFRVLAFVGYKNSGKTTLATKVLERLKAEGYRVGVLKHDVHDFQMDTEGKDTYKYMQAGADAVMISSGNKLNAFERLPEPPALNELLTRFRGVDLVIVEGYKNGDIDKILLARTPEQLSLADRLNRIAAVVTPLEVQTRFPVFHPDDLDGIIGFLKQHFGWAAGRKET